MKKLIVLATADTRHISVGQQTHSVRPMCAVCPDCPICPWPKLLGGSMARELGFEPRLTS